MQNKNTNLLSIILLLVAASHSHAAQAPETSSLNASVKTLTLQEKRASLTENEKRVLDELLTFALHEPTEWRALTIRKLLDLGADHTIHDAQGRSAHQVVGYLMEDHHPEDSYGPPGRPVLEEDPKTTSFTAIKNEASHINTLTTPEKRALLTENEQKILNEVFISSLHEAGTEQGARMIKHLLDLGANPDIRDAKGDPALHVALNLSEYSDSASRTREKIIRAFAQNNADFNIEFNTESKLTALLRVVHRGHHNAIKPLVIAGAKINHKDGDGKTPLMYTAYSARKETTQLLINLKADIAACDNYGGTAADYVIGYMTHMNANNNRQGYLRSEDILLNVLKEKDKWIEETKEESD